jgi:hypothetical protein
MPVEPLTRNLSKGFDKHRLNRLSGIGDFNGPDPTIIRVHAAFLQ